MSESKNHERLAHVVRTHRAELHDAVNSAGGAVHLARSMVLEIESAFDRGDSLRAGPLYALLGTTEGALGKLGDDLERILGTIMTTRRPPMSEPGTTARELLRTLGRELTCEDLDALTLSEQRALEGLCDHWRQLLQLRLNRDEANA